MRKGPPSITTDNDALLLRCGEEMSAYLLEIAEIRSPVTHSARVIFEDSVQDDRVVAEVIEHIQQLHDDLGDAVKRDIKDCLVEMIRSMGTMPGEHQASMFLSGFVKRRGIPSA